MDGPRLGHDVASPEARVDRGEGVLVDELDVPSHAAQRGAREGEQVLPAEGGRAGIRLDEAQDDASGGGLAGAGLADQAVGLARLDGDVDVRDGVDRAAAAAPTSGEGLGEAAGVEQRAGHGVAG